MSKDGNYLLDVGPTAEGVIIALIANNLCDAGKWLKYAGNCVYATIIGTRRRRTLSESFRFPTTSDAFCIVAFNKPSGGSVVIDASGVVPPIQEEDTIRLLGPTGGMATKASSGAWTRADY